MGRTTNGCLGTKVYEPQALTVIRKYWVTCGVRGVNLEELAKLRWIEKLPYGSMARRMKLATSTVHSRLQAIKLGGVHNLALDPADLVAIQARMREEEH